MEDRALNKAFSSLSIDPDNPKTSQIARNTSEPCFTYFPSYPKTFNSKSSTLCSASHDSCTSRSRKEIPPVSSLACQSPFSSISVRIHERKLSSPNRISVAATIPRTSVLTWGQKRYILIPRATLGLKGRATGSGITMRRIDAGSLGVEDGNFGSSYKLWQASMRSS